MFSVVLQGLHVVIKYPTHTYIYFKYISCDFEFCSPKLPKMLQKMV